MQSIDLHVSRRKFEEELSKFLKGEDGNRKRGVFLCRAEFPNLFFMFSATQLRPSPIIFAVKINFDNYDLDPLSVQFIDPFTWSTASHVPVPMLRKIMHAGHQPEFQPLAMQDQTGLPFICLPGIREYHNHPAHTGDSWLLHRNKGGEGSLGFIIDKLYEYGIAGINYYQIPIQIPVVQISYNHNQIPE